MKRIICAIDHWHRYLRAAKLAGSIAGKFGAELSLLTVVGVLDAQQDDIKQHLEREHNPESPAVALAEVAQDALRARADRIASGYGMHVGCQVRTGEAAAQIAAAGAAACEQSACRRAREPQPACQGIRRQHGPARAIETASCPILVVP